MSDPYGGQKYGGGGEGVAGIAIIGGAILAIPAVLISGLSSLTTNATRITTSQAQAKAAVLISEGHRAKLIAEAAITHQAALAVEADRLTAHAALYTTTQPNLLPLVIILSIIVIILVAIDLYALWRIYSVLRPFNNVD